MNRIPLILIGGGGHCKACIDVIEHQGCYDIKGILDDNEQKGSSVLGYPIIGNDSHIPFFVEKNYHFLVTVGQIKTAGIREKLFILLQNYGAKIATVSSPKAQISQHAKIARGTIVMHGVIVNANAVIGENTILNTNAIIEHDVVVGNHVHISTSAVVNGTVQIGNRVFIGSNSTLSNNIQIPDDVVVGAGSVVITSIEKRGVYVGNPSRMILSE